MADAEDKALHIHEPPDKSFDPNVEAGVEEVDIARIEKVYKYVSENENFQ